MEKRTFIALFIIFVFLTGYSYLMPRLYPPSSSPSASGSEFTLKIPAKESAIEDETIDLPQETIGEFIITYSPLGGYIKKLRAAAYDEEFLYKNIGFVEQDKEREFTPQIQNDRIVFTSSDGTRKEFIFDGNIIKITLSSSPSSLPDGPLLLFSSPLIVGMLEQGYQEFFYGQNDKLYRKQLKKVKNATYSNIEFAGVRDRYFCISLPKDNYEKIEWSKKDNEVSLFLPDPVPSPIALYIGPQTKKQLQPIGIEGIINYGFFHGIGVLLVKFLYLFNFLTKSWGASIILLSITVYAILFPFTMKSAKAMKKMQDLQPHIEELKNKYKDNPQKMNKEMLGLYRKYKINPLGGCLPLFFQFPVFIALYQVLLRFIELKGAGFLWIKDLSLPDRTFHLPVAIPFIGEYINILPLLIVVTGLIQQKVTTSSISSGSSDQKKMGLFFAVFLGVIFYKFPSCLVLYWFVQNIFTLLYQMRLAQKA